MADRRVELPRLDLTLDPKEQQRVLEAAEAGAALELQVHFTRKIVLDLARQIRVAGDGT